MQQKESLRRWYRFRKVLLVFGRVHSSFVPNFRGRPALTSYPRMTSQVDSWILGGLHLLQLFPVPWAWAGAFPKHGKSALVLFTTWPQVSATCWPHDLCFLVTGITSTLSAPHSPWHPRPFAFGSVRAFPGSSRRLPPEVGKTTMKTGWDHGNGGQTRASVWENYHLRIWVLKWENPKIIQGLGHIEWGNQWLLGYPHYAYLWYPIIKKLGLPVVFPCLKHLLIAENVDPTSNTNDGNFLLLAISVPCP